MSIHLVPVSNNNSGVLPAPLTTSDIRQKAIQVKALLQTKAPSDSISLKLKEVNTIEKQCHYPLLAFRLTNLYEKLMQLEEEASSLFSSCSDKLTAESKTLKEIKNQIQAGKTYHEIRPLFKSLSSESLKNLYDAIWISQGAFYNQPRGKEQIVANPQLLVAITDPLIAVQEGQDPKTLIDQAISLVESQILVAKQVESIEHLLERGASVSTAMYALPISFQNSLKQKLSMTDFPLIDHDPTLRARVKSQLKAILNDLMTFQLVDSKFSKKAIFEQALHHCSYRHRQLKALSKQLPIQEKRALTPPFPYIGKGVNPELYNAFGAHLSQDGKQTYFHVHAPHAQEVTLVLTAFRKPTHRLALQREGDNWRGVINNDGPEGQVAREGQAYVYEIKGADGITRTKSDPFAKQICLQPPANGPGSTFENLEVFESIVARTDKHVWNDQVWMKDRLHFDSLKHPLNIYELHLSSWKMHSDGRFYNYRELADELAAYCKDLGYTHVELMGVLDHPAEVSWGYQTSSFFAVNSRLGSPEDFQYFVDKLHQMGVGVIIDWVPGHFSFTERGLKNFDGGFLYESSYIGQKTRWGSGVFGPEKPFIEDFLLSSANFLADRFHIDGIRVDAVSASLGWIQQDAGGQFPVLTNHKGTSEYKEAQEFMRNLNSILHDRYPGILTIAEECTGDKCHLLTPVQQTHWTRPKKGGIGFNMQWLMGFTHDSLQMLAEKGNVETFWRLLHATHDLIGNLPRQVVLPYSHDEVATGKGSLIGKVKVFSKAEKMKHVRANVLYQFCRPGAKLTMMGNELMQTEEWAGRHKRAIDPSRPQERKTASVQWEELDPKVNPTDHHLHHGAKRFNQALNHFYLKNPALWEQSDESFEWVHTNAGNLVMAFHRKGSGQQLACVFNFSGTDFPEYLVPLPEKDLEKLTAVREVFMSDDPAFEGKAKAKAPVEIRRTWEGKPTHFKIRLPANTGIVLAEIFS